MRLLLITFLVFFSIAKSVKNAKCPKINQVSKIEDFSFPEKVFWRIYAYSDPGMKTMSLFTLHETQVDHELNCLKFKSSTYKGVNVMSHICFGFSQAMWILDTTKIYLNESKQESFYKELYSGSKGIGH